MADPPVSSRSPADSTGTPRWVKVFAIIAAVVVVIVIILMMAGGHGPGRHSGATRLAPLVRAS